MNLRKETAVRIQRLPLFGQLDRDERANIGVIMSLVGVSIGVLILGIVFVIGPVVGYNIENSVTLPATSNWNATNNQAITNGTELWQQNTPLLGSASIVVIAAVIIGVLLGSMMLQRR